MRLLVCLVLLTCLSGCASKFYGANGNIIASVPWPQAGTMEYAGTRMTVQPGEGTVQAAQVTVLGLSQQAPAVAVAAITAFQNKN